MWENQKIQWNYYFDIKEWIVSYSIISHCLQPTGNFNEIVPISMVGGSLSYQYLSKNDSESWGRERGVKLVCGLTALKINFFRGFKLGGGLGELDARGNGFHILWATSAKVTLAQKWNLSKVGGVMLASIRVRLSRGRVYANFGWSAEVSIMG